MAQQRDSSVDQISSDPLCEIDEGIWLATMDSLYNCLKGDLTEANDENADSVNNSGTGDKLTFTHIISLTRTQAPMSKMLKTFKADGGNVLRLDDVKDAADMDWKGLLKGDDLNDFLAEFKDAWDKADQKSSPQPKPKLVVYCFGAQTRSPLVLAYALIKLRGLNTYEALRKVSEMRTGRGFVWQFEESIQALEDYGGEIQGKRDDLFIARFFRFEGNFMRINMDYHADVTCSKPICKL